MQPRFTLSVIAAILLLSCISSPAPPATSTPRFLPTELAPGGMLVLPLQPDGTPEAHPVLVIESTVSDAVTGEPVEAAVYIVESEEYRDPTPEELALAGSDHFELTLMDELNGWLIVQAPGYETWKVHLSYNLKTSRSLSGPIQLKPKGL